MKTLKQQFEYLESRKSFKRSSTKLLSVLKDITGTFIEIMQDLDLKYIEINGEAKYFLRKGHGNRDWSYFFSLDNGDAYKLISWSELGNGEEGYRYYRDYNGSWIYYPSFKEVQELVADLEEIIDYLKKQDENKREVLVSIFSQLQDTLSMNSNKEE